MNNFFARLLALVVFALVLGTTSAQAQSKLKAATKSVELKGKAMVKSRGANPNIKSEMATTDKVVPQSRGELCGIHFDNRTGLSIKVYVDGDFYGVISPYGDEAVVVQGGYTRVYCVSAGGTREWSGDGNCTEIMKYTLQ